jgi:parvulin-like peptidyl-prolyl isomerase
MRKSKDWARLQQATGLPSDVLRDELVKADLAQLEVNRIAKDIHVSDSEIKRAYEANKKILRHNERIRLSSILVAAPEIDQGPIQSIKTQVHKANPKLEGKALENAIAQVLDQQQQKALVLLGEAKSPAVSFAKLANQNTDDVQAKIKQNGGDLGWQEKSQLVPQFADAVWQVKSGQVLPKLVKTGLGFQIIKVTNHEKPGTMSLSEVHDVIEAKVKQGRLQQAVDSWVANRHKSVKIEFSDDFKKLAQGDTKGSAATAVR